MGASPLKWFPAKSDFKLSLAFTDPAAVGNLLFLADFQGYKLPPGMCCTLGHCPEQWGKGNYLVSVSLSLLPKHLVFLFKFYNGNLCCYERAIISSDLIAPISGYFAFGELSGYKPEKCIRKLDLCLFPVFSQRASRWQHEETI